MRAVILAGGLGTRLRPYTSIIPKPLIPVGERPVLEHIIRSLARCGVDRVDLCVSHLGQLVHAYLSQAQLPEGLDVRFHWEERPLGTAGALRVVPDLDGTFIAMNGDILTTLDYRALLDFHLEHEATMTIATRVQRVPVDLGVIETTDSFVSGFVEKPTLHYRVSMGIYVYEARALRFLTEGACQFPELVLRLVESGERVAAFDTDAEWYDIGTPAEYERAAAAFERCPERFGAEPVDSDEVVLQNDSGSVVTVTHR
jgi:NDP-sugar pyrophosphorylase family protein